MLSLGTDLASLPMILIPVLLLVCCAYAITFRKSPLCRSSSTIHTIWMRGTPLLCGFLGTSFHASRNRGMAYLRQCFQVDTTWVPSKSLPSISTLKTGNVPVPPLVLYGFVSGGDHLPSGDKYACFPCLPL